MRQLVSLIRDNQVHYALVDDDDGSLIPFADLLLPNPESFGLHEAAVLGTNLINALGLNGHALAATRPQDGRDAPPALPAAPHAERATETPRERRNRIAREKYHSYKQPTKPLGTKARAKPENKVQRYISGDEVLAVINASASPITARDIAIVLAHTDPPPHWVQRTVENRIQSYLMAARDKGRPLPFTAEIRREGRYDRRYISHL